MKTLTLCADDFGLNPEVCEGILELMAHQRLNATSVMTYMPFCREYGHDLLAFAGEVNIGLHLNLTEPTEQTQWHSLSSLILRTHLRLLNKDKVRTTIQTQLDAFENTFSKQPDFVDGHQHIHQLPIIREILLETLSERYGTSPFVRSTHPTKQALNKDFKHWLIGVLGGHAFQRLLQQKKVPHNRCFSGIYSFNGSTAYEELFRAFLAELNLDCLMMCHPAKGQNPQDEIAAARAAEFAYLLSDNFPHDLEQAGFRLGKLTLAQ